MSKPTPTQLLAWAVENQTQEIQKPLEPIDPKWIEIILGKPDNARMMELVKSIQTLTDLNERIRCFDELEMMIESIDNANDLQPLKLWPILISFLNDKEPEIRKFAAWVMGTAVQNNEKAQDDFARNGGLEAILERLKTETEVVVAVKCVYCISSAVRAYKSNLTRFLNLNGFEIAIQACRDGNEELGRRLVFFFEAILGEYENCSEITDKLKSVGIHEFILTMGSSIKNKH